jgi:hypothetical protein
VNTKHRPKSFKVIVNGKYGYRAWCTCLWSGGPDFRWEHDALEHAQEHADASEAPGEGADTLDTLQAVSELPTGSVVEFADGLLTRVHPTPDRIIVEFFGTSYMGTFKEEWLPVRVIKRG